jgi:hypothetical protein
VTLTPKKSKPEENAFHVQENSTTADEDTDCEQESNYAGSVTSESHVHEQTEKVHEKPEFEKIEKALFPETSSSSSSRYV